jgi:hypothetical protein
MPRRSPRAEPTSPLQFARRYVGELIYGANDGTMTTEASSLASSKEHENGRLIERPADGMRALSASQA